MKAPKYGMFKSDKGNYGAMEIGDEDGRYHRAAGSWSCGYKIEGDKIVAVLKGFPHIDGAELIEVSEAEWRKDNEGYV